MPTLVLSPRLTSDSVRLERAAHDSGWGTYRARRYQLPEDLEDPVVYGDIVFCDVMARELGLGLLEPSNRWLAELPLEYLQRTVRAMSHVDLKHAVDSRHFVKPANDKVFEAGVFEHGAHVPHRYIDPRTPVLVSDVVFFNMELRCYVLDRRVCTAGVYAFVDENRSEGRERQLYENGLEWMGKFLLDNEIEMPSAVVIDVGFNPEFGWAVVEANQAYASGLYVGGFVTDSASPGCDLTAVLPVLERSGGLRQKVTAEDEKWLRPIGTP
jgi:hypothetical protein